mmetsp:Transcript_78500/g.199708  ORF Transcript_78500/g.199708 Transcript_78500/m.199708 type:complete len:202 (-) Transcript_78500:24-629(-)
MQHLRQAPLDGRKEPMVVRLQIREGMRQARGRRSVGPAQHFGAPARNLQHQGLVAELCAGVRVRHQCQGLRLERGDRPLHSTAADLQPAPQLRIRLPRQSMQQLRRLLGSKSSGREPRQRHSTEVLKETAGIDVRHPCQRLLCRSWPLRQQRRSGRAIRGRGTILHKPLEPEAQGCCSAGPAASTQLALRLRKCLQQPRHA